MYSSRRCHKNDNSLIIGLFFLIIALLPSLSICEEVKKDEPSCLIGAFLANKPTREDIADFKAAYGKKPSLILVFIDWESFVDKKVIEDVYAEGCRLIVTWEPWFANKKEGADYSDILSGEYDRYITDFAVQLKGVGKEVFVRFAHEMNGDWYPWSGAKMGSDRYAAMYRHVRDVFDKAGASNVKWIFAVNWEDIPKHNTYLPCYPGDAYVDYIGIDGYNWGTCKQWSKWMSFTDIFKSRYDEISSRFNKPIMISEFSSSSCGGDKCVWMGGAMDDITKMDKIRAFILFNISKETDWSVDPGTDVCKQFKDRLKSSYFK